MVKVFIIAEAGVNHNGKLSLARKLVDAAAAAQADAVKFQTFSAQRLVLASAPKAAYQQKVTARGESQLTMLKGLELSQADHLALREYCRKKGIIFLSTPFDEQAADFLNSLKMPVFKIPSGELTNIPFIKHVASLGKPMIISTGMGNLNEVKAAVVAARRSGNRQLTLLHCVSLYPTPVELVNLKAMATLAKTFGLPVGFSDHTLGTDIPLAAVAMGAVVIEKHLTLNRQLPGPDQKVSLEPAEFKMMVASIRRVSLAMGDGVKRAAVGEGEVAAVARKSLVTTCTIAKGERVTQDMLMAKRPGTGISPAKIASILGKRAKQLINQNVLIKESMLL